jgi:hypothetical protein
MLRTRQKIEWIRQVCFAVLIFRTFCQYCVIHSNPLKNKINLNYILSFKSYRAVNILRLCYKWQVVPYKGTITTLMSSRFHALISYIEYIKK